ncbi:SMI1/KNR4 family protein [Nocardia sp. NPDC003482]
MRLIRTSLLLVAAVAAACSTTHPTQAVPADDWCRVAIDELSKAQRDKYERDKAQGNDKPWLLTRPGPPASDAAIREAQSRLGVRFDQQYTQWLRHVNGWESFASASDFFPVEQVSRDSRAAQNFSTFLDAGEFTPAEVGVDSLERLIVIGGSVDGDAYFIVLQTSDADVPGMPVFEFSHGDFARYDDLKTFIQRRIERLR